TEFGLMAGADRVEGTLFGNGERTGNADIVTIAMNLYVQGIDPGLDFSNINRAKEIYEESTNLPVHPRHPYAGELVFTAFSGSHQDAISKGMKRMRERQGIWAVPYLPIDPRDVGRSYDPIIRFNSQSGKGGAAFILEYAFGIQMPKRVQQDFGPVVINASDARSSELNAEDLYQLFKATYVNIETPVKLLGYQEVSGEPATVTARITYKDDEVTIKGEGDGLVDAFCKSLSDYLNISFEIINYSQHSMERGNKSRAITFVEFLSGGKTYYGAGMSGNIGTSSLRAVVSAVNKVLK
ncbi:MAG: 2-isopropylmalate synthase, partial [Clostridiales bacterium]|nr:2-isopropylmalate synthase [Clostridiales bacterium]